MLTLKSKKSKSKWKTISQIIIKHRYKNNACLGFGGQLGIKIISFSNIHQNKLTVLRLVAHYFCLIEWMWRNGGKVLSQTQTFARKQKGASRSNRRRWETQSRWSCRCCCNFRGLTASLQRKSAAGWLCSGLPSRKARCWNPGSYFRVRRHIVTESQARRARCCRYLRYCDGWRGTCRGKSRWRPGTRYQLEGGRPKEHGWSSGARIKSGESCCEWNRRSWRSDAADAGSRQPRTESFCPRGWSDSGFRTDSIQTGRKCDRLEFCIWDGGTDLAARSRRGRTDTCCRICSCRALESFGTARSCTGSKAVVPGEEIRAVGARRGASFC